MDKYKEYLDAGNKYFEESNFDLALENYKKALELYPNDPEIYKNIGNVYTQQKKYDKGEEYYNRAIQIDPKYYKAYYNLGILYFESKNIEQAIEYFKKTIKIEPSYTPAYNNLGATYSCMRNYDKAIEIFNKALEINPQHFVSYVNLADIYFSQEKYDLAIENYEKALEIDAVNFELFSKIGKAYIKLLKLSFKEDDEMNINLENQKYYNKAIEYIGKALTLNKKDRELKFLLGQLYIQQDLYIKALDIFNNFIKEDELDPNLYFYIGLINYFYVKDYPKAIEYLEKSIELNFNGFYGEIYKYHKAIPYFYIGAIYIDLKEYNIALEKLLEAEKLADFDNRITTNIAFTYQRLKDYENSIIYYNKALDRENYKKTKSLINYCLGTIHEELNDFQSAKQFYENSLKIDLNNISALKKLKLLCEKHLMESDFIKEDINI